MEKKVMILSAGLGDRQTMSTEAAALAEQADLLIGASRLVEAWPDKQTAAEYRPERIRRLVEESEAETIAVLVSGDAGFFSGAGAIARALEPFHPVVLPGISSIAGFSAKIGIPYDGARLISAHGRDINIVSEVRRHRVTFVLCGDNMQALLARLDMFGMNEVQVFAGENLGYPEERILSGTPGELKDSSFGRLAVMAVINENAYAPAAVSIADKQMIRGSVPMTKELVRGAVIRELRLREDSVVYDIGAGTGSVSVEAALNAWRGTVYAFDHSEEAIRLIRENALRMKADNVAAVQGTAPEILRGLPVPDAVFIGGSDGKLEEILDALPIERKKNEGKTSAAVRNTGAGKPFSADDRDAPPDEGNSTGNNSGSINVVITAVTLQTLEKAAELLKEMKLPAGEKIRISQISENRVVKMGRYDMFRPETPVFLLSAEICRREEQEG